VQNKAFEGPRMRLGLVKIVSVQGRLLSENRLLPKTVRFLANPAHQGTFNAK
jgi:hypothetical protein